jgi:hypothetical protein
MSIKIDNTQNFSQIITLSTLSPEDLSQFSFYELSTIEKKGLPAPIYKFLMNVYRGVSEKLSHSQHLMDNGYLVAVSELEKAVARLSLAKNWKKGSLEDLKLLIRTINGFPQIAFVKKLSQEDYQALLLIHHKILELAATKIAQEFYLGNEGWTILTEPPVSPSNLDSTHFVIFCTEGKWNVYHFLQIKNEQPPPINLNHEGQFLMLEKDLSAVHGQRIFVDCDWDMESYQTNDTWAFSLLRDSLLKEMKISSSKTEITSFPNIIIKFYFYEGFPLLNSKQPNTVVFATKLNPNNLTFSPIEKISPKEEISSSVTGKLETILELLKEDWVENVKKNYPRACTFEIATPNTPLDWAEVKFRLLFDLAKEPEKNTDLILWLAEETDVSFSLEELQKASSEEEKISLKKEEDEIELSPNTIATAMLTQAQNEYKKEKSSPSTSTPQLNPSLITQDKEKQKKVLNTAPKKSSPQNAKAPSKGFILDQKEKEQVRSVFQGNPMKAQEFNKFAARLLRKKMEASQAKINQTVKGSHPKIHFKQENGSGGISFRIHHGKKDSVVPVHHQKRTLKEILFS